jgi:type IV pilus assembly protein PilN
MRIPINLSSEPFRRDRPVLVASAVLSVVLTVLLIVLSSVAISERNRAKEAREAIAKAEGELKKIVDQQVRLETMMRQPQNAEVLERSQFINMLIARKGVSWTKIFHDLESVMPHNVRLISVRPQLNGPNDLLLDMQVASQSDEPVSTLLMQLESSPMFGTTTLHSWLPPSQTEPLYRYRVSVTYAQKL